jgi:valyl-tRNA synthetase
MIESVRAHLADYRLDLAAKALYEFTWNEYCDWYLELTKPILQGDGVSAEQQAATRGTLIVVLEALLRCLHPMIPFITEEIWQRVARVTNTPGDTIMLRPFPASVDFAVDNAAEEELEWIRNFILGIRQIRGEMDISPGKALPVLIQDADTADQQRIAAHSLYLQKIAQLESISLLDESATPPTSATALLGDMKIFVPVAGLIDVAAERERLNKRRAKAQADLGKVESKLANESFVARAPEEVVTKEKGRQDDLRREIKQLDDQINQLSELS